MLSSLLIYIYILLLLNLKNAKGYSTSKFSKRDPINIFEIIMTPPLNFQKGYTTPIFGRAHVCFLDSWILDT